MVKAWIPRYLPMQEEFKMPYRGDTRLKYSNRTVTLKSYYQKCELVSTTTV